MGESRGRYRAEYDAPAVKRINKALIKYGNGVGQSLGSSNIFEFLFIAAIAVLIYAWLISRDRSPALAGLTGCTIAGILGAAWRYWSTLKYIDSYRGREEGEIWECEVSDEAWSYRKIDGTLVTHPWKTIDLQFSHEDGFIVETSIGQITVFRKPLAQAGLEELFLQRINKPAGGRSSAQE
jgi:hypothetical protein